MSDNHKARSGGIIWISFQFSFEHEGMLCVLIRSATSLSMTKVFSTPIKNLSTLGMLENEQ